MSKIENAKAGTIALIQQQENGRILQVALTEQQSNMLQFFLAKMSQETKLIQMPEEYDLVLKSQYKKLLKTLEKAREHLVIDVKYKTWSHLINEVDLELKSAKEVLS